METWPEWLITGDPAPKRIRLFDERARRRLKIAPEGTAPFDDVVWLRRADFDRLASMAVPWRTAWRIRAAPPENAEDIAEVQQALEHWRSAWEQRNLAAYLAMYSESFAPQDPPDAERWRLRKRQLFARDDAVSVRLTRLSIVPLEHASVAVATFEQHYRSKGFESTDLKAVRWRREGTGWRITTETVLRRGLEPVRRSAE